MSDHDPIIWQGRLENMSSEFKRVNPKDYDKAGHHEEIIHKLRDIDTNANERLKQYNKEREVFKSQFESIEATKIMKENGLSGRPAPLNINETARNNVAKETSATNANERANQEIARQEALADIQVEPVTPKNPTIDNFKEQFNTKARDGLGMMRLNDTNASDRER